MTPDEIDARVDAILAEVAATVADVLGDMGDDAPSEDDVHHAIVLNYLWSEDADVLGELARRTGYDLASHIR